MRDCLQAFVPVLALVIDTLHSCLFCQMPATADMLLALDTGPSKGKDWNFSFLDLPESCAELVCSLSSASALTLPVMLADQHTSLASHSSHLTMPVTTQHLTLGGLWRGIPWIGVLT